jgi:hypothetical protein
VQWEDIKPQEERATRKEIFKHYEVSRTQGFKMIKGMYDKLGELESLDLGTLHPRRHHNDPAINEARGAKRLLIERDIRRLERIIWRNGFKGQTLTWEQLAEEVDIPGKSPREIVSGKTI